MKTWLKKFEWMGYTACEGDARFIAESSLDDPELSRICSTCQVRPECIQYALESESCGVFVAGVRLPDPIMGDRLRRIRRELKAALPQELSARGEI